MNTEHKNVTLNFSTVVHKGTFIDGKFYNVKCGAEFTSSQNSRKATAFITEKEVSCKRCLRRLKNENKTA